MLSLAVSAQCMCFTVNAENVADSTDGIRTITVDNSNDNITEIELYEGEQVQLDFQLDPAIYDLEDVRSYEENKSPIVSYDGKLAGCSSGKYRVDVFVRNTVDYGKKMFILDVNVLPNENISAENRAELDRINNFLLNDYRRRKMELVGALDEESPRLTIDKMQEIIDSANDYDEIIKKANKYVGYPDDVSGSGNVSYTYWFDAKGSETISIGVDSRFIAYTKTADDGTVIGSQLLYPEKTEFLPNGKDKNYDYIQYNQIKPAGNGTLNLKFINGTTGEPFTETNGKFQLVSEADDNVIKSWDTSEGSEITIGDLSPEDTYELRYIDDYHGEFPDQYRYEIDHDKGTSRFSFGYDSELSHKVYLRKRHWGDPQLIGDVNSDDRFNIADVVILQKWLLGKPDTVLMNWGAADLCSDGVLDVYDLCLMKRELRACSESQCARLFG
ncbi:MAG: dockerin type I repeat-containing protein [Ruminococcus sp.]|nr:dockerin type I repeat-containing protein [Ruminococcus sp.]